MALKVTRINLSFETIELLGAWEWEGLRFTAGPSYILHTDTDLKRNSVQAGIDYQSRKAIFKPTINLFASVLYHAWEETDWNPDLTSKSASTSAAPMPENGPFRF